MTYLIKFLLLISIIGVCVGFYVKPEESEIGDFLIASCFNFGCGARA